MRALTVSSPLFTGAAVALFATWGCSDPADPAAGTQQTESGVTFGNATLNPRASTEQAPTLDSSPTDAPGSAQADSRPNQGVQEEPSAQPPLVNGSQSVENSQGSSAQDNSTPADNSGGPMPGEGAGGAAMTAPPVQPAGTASSGCGVGAASPPDDLVDNNFLSFPPDYDGTTPTPLVFGFHGAGRTNIEQREVDSRTIDSSLEQNYVVAYMKSAGSGWDLGSDLPRLQQARQQIFEQLCIDTSQVFAFGHSSGAQFITQMLGSTNEQFTGVVVVASSNYNNFPWQPVPTLSIHGLNDRSRGGDPDGTIDLVQYTTSNGCSNERQPVDVTACNSIASLPGNDNPAVNAGCVEFVGCQQPTIFCNHDDINYVDNGNPTNHGWPCFANDEIFQFIEGLR